MLSVVDEIGGEFSNSYCAVSYADDYWYNHFSTTMSAQWDALEDAQKQQLLVQGTSVIERIRFTVPYENNLPSGMVYDPGSGQVVSFTDFQSPCKYYYYQALQFPRNIDTDSEGNLQIPVPVKMALCEQAIYLINFDQSAHTKSLVGIRSESVGVGKGQIQKSTTYSDAGPGSVFSLSPLAWEFLSPYALKDTLTLRRA